LKQPVELTSDHFSFEQLSGLAPTLQAIADAIRHAGISPLDLDAMECHPQLCWISTLRMADAV